MADVACMDKFPVAPVLEATDAEIVLSDLLERWHKWQRSYSHNRGYPALSAGCGDWRASRQYDFENGAMDAAVDRRIMETIDFEVQEMPEPGKTGIYVNARALAVGLSVFRSPRLPESQIECLKIISAARTELIRRLLNRGVM